MGKAERFARHRFEHDIQDLSRCRNQYFLPHASVSFALSSEPGAKHLNTIICGVEPLDGVYSGARWPFVIQLPESYPFCAPQISATQPIFHPNVDPQTGAVSLRLLETDWSPVLTLRIVVLGLVLLFVEPNLESPANPRAAQLLRDDANAFVQRVAADRDRMRAAQGGAAAPGVRPKRPCTDPPGLVRTDGLAKRRFIFQEPAGPVGEEGFRARRDSASSLNPDAAGGAQRILVQKLTHCSLSQSRHNKRRKLL